jgi:purine-binding chemotaxis protein CheW
VINRAQVWAGSALSNQPGVARDQDIDQQTHATRECSMSVQTEARFESTAVVDRRAGKYLTFVLAGEEYGLEILKVREIMGMMDTTAVPAMPDYVNGVINLRGKVIPVIDMRLKFSMVKAERNSETCIIVVDVRGNLMGVVVDKVSEVLDIRAEEIEDAPNVGVTVENAFILGMAKAKGRVKILLDIDKVLSAAACAELTATA